MLVTICGQDMPFWFSVEQGVMDGENIMSWDILRASVLHLKHESSIFRLTIDPSKMSIDPTAYQESFKNQEIIIRK